MESFESSCIYSSVITHVSLTQIDLINRKKVVFFLYEGNLRMRGLAVTRFQRCVCEDTRLKEMRRCFSHLIVLILRDFFLMRSLARTQLSL